MCRRDSRDKIEECLKNLVSNLWGTSDWDFTFVEAQGRSGGLLMMWNKNKFNCEFVVKDEWFVAIIGNWDKKEG